MEFYIFMSVISLTTVFYIYTIISNFKSSKDRSEYYFCSNKLKIGSLVLTLIATQIGGGTVLGLTDEAYKVGLVSLFYPLGTVVGFCIAALCLDKFIKRSGISTAAQVFEIKYSFPVGKKIASIISSISLFFIAAAQGIAVKKLLSIFGVNQYLLFIPIWLSIVAYASLGGLRAVIQTDVLQILLVFFGLFIVTLFSINNFDFFFDLSGEALFTKGATVGTMINWFIWPCGYMLIEQDMMQRFAAAESSKIMRRASILSAIGMMLIALMPVMMGIIAKNQMPDVESESGILLLFAKNYLSPSLYMLTFTAVILAIFSTLDSILCAISSNIACDFNLPKKKYFKGLISLEIIITALIGVSSLIAVYYCKNIIQILIFAYSLCVSVLCVPLTLGMFLKNPQKSAAISSMICGFVSYAAFYVASLYDPAWGDLSCISILFSLAGYFVYPVLNRGLANNSEK